MNEPQEHRPRQEEDRIAGRPPLVIAGLTVAAVVASCLVAWGLLALWSEGERAEVRLEPMQATPRWAAPTGPGPTRGPFASPGDGEARRDEPEAWSWVDREAGVVRIPVDAAMTWLAGEPEAVELLRGGGDEDTLSARPSRDGDERSDAAAPEASAGEERPARPPGHPPGDTLRILTAGPSLRDGQEGTTPPALDGVEIDERPGARLPLDAEFSAAAGGGGELGDFLAEDAPTLLVPGYYRCRMLCSYVLEGLARGVAGMDPPPESAYRVVAVTIDPREKPADAADRRERAEAVAGAEAVERRWRFLLGSEGSIRRLTRAIGFGYRYDESTDQFAHAAAVVALTPEGRVSGYLYGMEFEPAEVREALEVAAAGETRTTLEQVLVRCFRYLPALRRHAGLIAGILRGGGALILLAAGAVVVVAVRRRARAREGA